MKYLKKFKTQNESLIGFIGIITVSFIIIAKLLKWFLKLRMDRENREMIENVYKSVRIASELSKFNYGRVNISDFEDRWYIDLSNYNIPSVRILKDEKILILFTEKREPLKLKLTDSEYNEFLKIIKQSD